MFGGKHHGYLATLAMARNAYLFLIDFGHGAQIAHSSESIVGKVESGVVDAARRRSAGATVIVAKHRYALTGEIVGYHGKGFVAHEFLIAVLRAATGHQHHGSEPFFALRQSESAGKSGTLARESYFALLVREWRHRCLRAIEIRIAVGKIERYGQSRQALLKRPLECIGLGIEREIERHAEAFNSQVSSSGREINRVAGYVERHLVGRIEPRMRLIGYANHQRHFLHSGIERAGPLAGERVSIGRNGNACCH